MAPLMHLLGAPYSDIVEASQSLCIRSQFNESAEIERMPTGKRILVLEKEKLLSDAVFSLLSSRPEYHVAHVQFDELGALNSPDHAEPDVIIMDQGVVANNISAVMELVDRHPKVRLIIIGLSDNVLHVFDKSVVDVSDVSEFIAQL